MKLLITLAVLAMLAIGIRLTIPRLGNSVAGGIVERDSMQQLAPCPGTPNCHLDEFIISGDATNAIDTIADIVGEQPGTHVVTRDARYLHATFSTALMGYVDDVEFLLKDADAGSQPVVQVRSASRLGHSDLGANAKRVESLRQAAIGRL